MPDPMYEPHQLGLSSTLQSNQQFACLLKYIVDSLLQMPCTWCVHLRTVVIRFGFSMNPSFIVEVPRQCARRTRLFVRCSSASTSSRPKKVVFLGTPEVAAASLRRLVSASSDQSFTISAVVTQPPAPVGRKRIVAPSPVHQTALSIPIPNVLTPVSARETSFLEQMRQLGPDLCITAAYGNFLPQAFLKIPAYGTLNIHPSLLPKFRGAAPVPRALEAGVCETGVSIAFTVLKMDSGPIIAQPRVALNGDEQAPELLNSLFQLGTERLIELLPSVWDRSVKQVEQDEAKQSQAPKLSKDEARLTFVENARIVHNKVRALAGWPGTWADFVILDGEQRGQTRLKILNTSVLRRESGMCLGVHQVRFNDEMRCMTVTCDDGSLLAVHDVQPPSKKAMPALAFWNGLRGKRLERKRVPH